MAEASGYAVTVPNTLTMSTACCRCGAPATESISSSQNVDASRSVRTIPIPYCDACLSRAKAIQRARIILHLKSICIALVASGFGAAVPTLTVAAMITVPCVLAVLVGVLLRNAAGTDVEFPFGAWLIQCSPFSSTIFCTNEKWAHEMAKNNNCEANAASQKDTVAPWISGLLVALPLSIYVAIAARPTVYIDNGGNEPLKLWVDGKPSIAVEPMRGVGPRPALQLAYGTHRFGVSPLSAGAPSEQTDLVQVKWNGDHLYNPGKTSCFWIDATAYGKASTSGMTQGPQTISDFYTFPHIDNWFQDNPTSIRTKASGETRVSLQTMPICRQLIERGCGDVRIRQSMIACQQSAFAKQDQNAFDACIDTAIDVCNSSRAGVPIN